MIAPWALKKSRLSSSTYQKFYTPIRSCLSGITPLTSRGDRPLTFTLEHQLEMLVFYHLQGHESEIEFLQAMEEDDFAREHIAPKEGIKKSAFYEAISERGLLQLQEIFHSLYAQAKNIVPKKYAKLAELVAVDGSLVDATLSMYWAEYREGSNKFKAHVGFNVNQGIPQKLHLTEGKGGERPFVGKIVNPGQTAILDRGYQDHSDFSISGMRTAVTSFAGSRNIQLKNSSPWSVLKWIQTRPPRLSESDGGQALSFSLMVQFCSEEGIPRLKSHSEWLDTG